jgi:hypothetical protein
MNTDPELRQEAPTFSVNFSFNIVHVSVNTVPAHFKVGKFRYICNQFNVIITKTYFRKE